MTVYALRLGNGVDTAARVRYADMLALPAGPAPLTARTALRPDGGGVVSVVSGAMQVRVQPFAGWVQSGTVAQAGYPVVSDAVETLTVTAGHASLTRVDTVALVVRDNAADGSGFTDTRLLLVAGTPGQGAPVLPPTALPLWDVNVPAGASTGSGGLQPSALGVDRRVYPPPAYVDQATAWVTVGDSGAPPFVNSWSHANGSTLVQYRLNSIGDLQLRGQATGGTNALAFTLPAGFRPSGQAWTQMQTTDTGTAQTSVAVSGAVTLETKSGIPTFFGVYLTVPRG